MNKCNQCGKAYKSKRSTSKYCSAKCRKLAFRVTVPEVSVPVFDKDANLVGTYERNGDIKSHVLSMTTEDIESVGGHVDSHGIAHFGDVDCECGMCHNKVINKSNNIINHGEYKVASELGENEINRVSLPDDVDYDGRMVYVDGAWHQR